MSREEVAEAVTLWVADHDEEGRDVPFDANYLGKLERGVVRCPKQRYVDALCAVLNATPAELGFDSAAAIAHPLVVASPVRAEQERGEDSAGEVPAVPEEGGAPQRRETLKLSLALAVTPDVLNRVLSDAATEAQEFTQSAGVSAVGRGTLDHFEVVVSDLNRAWMTTNNSPAEQFVVTRVYRSRVDELIRGRHTLKELQELYVYAACFSERLAWLARDLGNSRTAQAYALDAYTYADEVGHGELCGWASDAMASAAIDPDSAASAATRGAAKVSASHPLAVQLHAQAALTHAQLGQREHYETLFGEAQRLYERLPARTPLLFGKDMGLRAFYSMISSPVSAYVSLGDFTTARTHGEAAVAAHESTPFHKAPRRAAVAKLNLATALVGLGAPDDAVALGSQALASIRVVPSWVVTCAYNLDRVLRDRYPNVSCTREFHEQYRHVAQRSPQSERV